MRYVRCHAVTTIHSLSKVFTKRIRTAIFFFHVAVILVMLRIWSHIYSTVLMSVSRWVNVQWKIVTLGQRQMVYQFPIFRFFFRTLNEMNSNLLDDLKFSVMSEIALCGPVMNILAGNWPSRQPILTSQSFQHNFQYIAHLPLHRNCMIQWTFRSDGPTTKK